MPEMPMAPTPAPVASSRRYIILGGLALVVIAVSIAVVMRRPVANPNNLNVKGGVIAPSQSSSTGRPTFERFQASTTNANANVPTATTPTLEQTQQAIKELQQQ